MVFTYNLPQPIKHCNVLKHLSRKKNLRELTTQNKAYLQQLGFTLFEK